MNGCQNSQKCECHQCTLSRLSQFERAMATQWQGQAPQMIQQNLLDKIDKIIERLDTIAANSETLVERGNT